MGDGLLTRGARRSWRWSMAGNKNAPQAHLRYFENDKVMVASEDDGKVYHAKVRSPRKTMPPRASLPLMCPGRSLPLCAPADLEL